MSSVGLWTWILGPQLADLFGKVMEALVMWSYCRKYITGQAGFEGLQPLSIDSLHSMFTVEDVISQLHALVPCSNALPAIKDSSRTVSRSKVLLLKIIFGHGVLT